MKLSPNFPSQRVQHHAQEHLDTHTAASSSSASQTDARNLAHAVTSHAPQFAVSHAAGSQAYAALHVLLQNNKLSTKDHFKLVANATCRSDLIETCGKTLNQNLIKFLAKYPELHDALLKRVDKDLSIEALQVMLKNTPESNVEKHTEISKKIQDIQMEKLLKMTQDFLRMAQAPHQFYLPIS